MDSLRAKKLVYKPNGGGSPDSMYSANIIVDFDRQVTRPKRATCTSKGQIDSLSLMQRTSRFAEPNISPMQKSRGALRNCRKLKNSLSRRNENI